PNADASFCLDASLTERAERRFRELESGAKLVGIEDVLDNISSRDKMDEKQWKPLLDSGRAIVVDTTGMTIQAVVDRILELLPGGSDR
ncbi:MAG: (d)CMP kinase, partial [Planctomycetes bacterium]|nr:(d)CMP kinase [Planctomycetota bacterium]